MKKLVGSSMKRKPVMKVEVGVELGKIKKVDEFVREITSLGWV